YMKEKRDIVYHAFLTYIHIYIRSEVSYGIHNWRYSRSYTRDYSNISYHHCRGLNWFCDWYLCRDRSTCKQYIYFLDLYHLYRNNTWYSDSCSNPIYLLWGFGFI